MIKGTYFCLQAVEVGKPARLSIKCANSDSKWETITDSKLQLSAKTSNGDTVCLDIDSANDIVTNTCKCLSRDNSCDPSSQWFKLVDSTRNPRLESFTEINPIMELPVEDSEWKSLTTA